MFSIRTIKKISAPKLRTWSIRTRHIGRDIGRAGMADQEIIPLLHGLPRTAFLTRDADFYRGRPCHPGYCLAVFDVG
jgi:hypothetical protein